MSLIDHRVREVEHGRFERTLAALTAFCHRVGRGGAASTRMHRCMSQAVDGLDNVREVNLRGNTMVG